MRALTVRLRSAGYETLSASDGPAAMELALSQQPDLVLLDIGLPFEDGYQVATKLRMADRTAHIPIVFLTARTWDLDKAHQVRPDGYVVKPYEPAELLNVVGRLTANLERKPATVLAFSNPDRRGGRILAIDEKT